MNAQQLNNNTFAAQTLDAVEYVVTVLENGAVVYTELDEIVLQFGTDLI